ncbi:DUF488 domain-containing protein [Dinghuibacter silviterrae]|uniref:Uncharacterized protein YeaO (DUF488 family) n=1 Tax=Dinghuibacter silviterrae TaxID=1539049 RepID=A0A4R8DGC2_9BACT|nr:DUF488 family protein [Dinghuibacter silviterrae]TDW96156.1 uncharacterized protein YeaO (DUF488 family) [Dinghuibacter silviterrae]
MATITVKRIYDPPANTDGYRVLVDRLWPRGVSKEKAHIDLWLKEVAPSTELRQWFHAHMDQWETFSRRYDAELYGSAALAELKALVKKHPHVTLLYASREETQNHALLLAKLLH